MAESTINSTSNTEPKDSKALEPSRWSFATIDGTAWDKAYPYQLVLCKKDEQGDWTVVAENSTEFAGLNRFTLPIAPEALNITSPFAVTTTATLNGVVEEHNGIVFKNIAIRGTTGVLPLRNNAPKETPGLNPQTLGGVFAGTIQAINNTALLLPGSRLPNVVPKSDFENKQDVWQNTGFYQFHLLQKWLESYTELKRKRGGQNYAMGFAINKDKAVYICTPLSFDLQRAANSPLEYNYSLNLRSWKRIALDKTLADAHHVQPVARDISAMARVLNALTAARAALEEGKNIIKAFRGDVNTAVFQPMKEASLFVKDFLGLQETAADLPSNLINDFREALLEAKTINQAPATLAAQQKSASVKIQKSLNDLAIEAAKIETDSSRLSSSDVLGLDPTKTAHPANKPGAMDDYTFQTSIVPANLPLKAVTRKKIQEEKTRVRNLKREDFEESRGNVLDFLNNFEASLGLLPQAITDVYGVPQQSKVREPTQTDFDIIYALNQAVQQFDHLAASSTIDRSLVETMDFFAGLANRSGIAFTVPQSKILVPFPYGHTLEKLSEMYFGTPERWQEIAALNGLQSPYVDEEGFVLPLLTNGVKNTVMVSDASRLFVNQPVWISSSTVARIKRRITKIEELVPGQWLVTVDGNSDLEVYTTAGSAFLQAFLPNTINSQQSLYIPSDDPTNEDDYRQKEIPGIDQFDPLVRVGGVDLLLDSNNDLVFTPDGNGRFAAGLTNIMQKLRILVATPRGSLMDHPEYGFPIQPGQSQADMNAKDVLRICNELFRDDPTFSGVKSATVVADGPAVVINMQIMLRGVNKSIPVSIKVVR